MFDDFATGDGWVGHRCIACDQDKPTAIYAIRYRYSNDTDLIARTCPVHREPAQFARPRRSACIRTARSDGALIIVRTDDAVAAFALVDADPFNEVGVIGARGS